MCYSAQPLQGIQVIHISLPESLNQLPDFRQVGGLSRCGDPLYAQGSVFDTPVLDHASKSVIGDGLLVDGKDLASDGAGRMFLVEPSLDGRAVEGMARGEGNGVEHELERNGAEEVGRDSYVQLEQERRHAKKRVGLGGSEKED